MSEAPLLSVRSLTTGYGDVAVTHDLSFDIRKGELTSLMGSNGAGKTATLLAIMGVNRTRSGQVLLDGADMAGMGSAARVRQGISLVLEGRRLFPGLSVFENLEIARAAAKNRDGTRLEAVLDLFPPLRELLDRPAGALSGGEAQMCAIGRGLMSEPRLLLVDELSLGLAPQIVDVLLEAISRIHDELDTTMLFVEQDTERSLSVAHRAIVLSRGRKIMDASVDEVSERRDDLERAFLGLVEA